MLGGALVFSRGSKSERHLRKKINPAVTRPAVTDPANSRHLKKSLEARHLPGETVSAAVASTENSSHSVAARAAGIPSLSRTSNENMLALQQVGQQTTQSEPIIAVDSNMSIVLPRLEEVEAKSTSGGESPRALQNSRPLRKKENKEQRSKVIFSWFRPISVGALRNKSLA